MGHTGNPLLVARTARGLTQQEVEQAAGLPPGAVSRYETGKTDMRASTLLKLSEIYGVSTDQLMGQQPLVI